MGVIPAPDAGQYSVFKKSCYNESIMKRTTLEPGLLSVFRLLTGLRFGLIVLIGMVGIIEIFFVDEPYLNLDNTPFEWVSAIEVTLLMIYLWWPSLPERLGKAFLPMGLLLATIGPLLGYHAELLAEFNETETGILVEAWQLFLILFVPLVLIGWQYNLRAVILFSVGTALLDGGLTLLSGYFGNPHVISLQVVVLIRTATYVLVGYMVVQSIAGQRQQRQALAQANAKLTQFAATLEQLTISRERNHLARELHDTLAHTLSGTAVQLEAVKTVWNTNPDQARAMLEQSSETIRTGLTETRRALQALRASPLEDLGLVLAVRELAESTANQTGAALNWRSIDQVDHIAPVVEQGIYRIAQEVLANIVKHAAAQTIAVQLGQSNGQVTLWVSDDGVGFEPNQIDNQYHFGLQGMQERAKMIGGELTIGSAPEQGTTVHLVVTGGSE